MYGILFKGVSGVALSFKHYENFFGQILFGALA
jgi:hypothetical protein